MLLLYRQTSPVTALVLAGDRYTLTFRRPAASPSSSTASSSNSSPQIELSFDPISDFDVLGCSLLCQVHSSLGLVQLASPSSTGNGSTTNDIFLSVIAHAQSLTSRYNPEEQVSRIQSVDFYSVSSTTWDEWHGGAAGVPPSASATTGGLDDGYALDHSSMPSSGTSTPTAYSSSSADPAAAFAHPATAMRKILSNGHFYFSSGNYDISTRLEERLRRRDEETTEEDADDDLGGHRSSSYDSRFVWNSFLMDSLLDFRSNLSHEEKQAFDGAAFVVTAIQGFVGVSDFTLSGNPVTLSLISRLGSARAGTRFNARGIDDDGNVANFVEVRVRL